MKRTLQIVGRECLLYTEGEQRPLPMGRLLGESLRGLSARLQVSLRPVHEAVYEPCEAEVLPYVRNGDSVRSRHGEPPVVANYFFHEEIVVSFGGER